MLVLSNRSNNVLSHLTISLLFSRGKSRFKYDKEIAFPNNGNNNTFRNPSIWFYLFDLDSKRVKSSSQHFFLRLLWRQEKEKTTKLMFRDLHRWHLEFSHQSNSIQWGKWVDCCICIHTYIYTHTHAAIWKKTKQSPTHSHLIHRWWTNKLNVPAPKMSPYAHP